MKKTRTEKTVREVIFWIICIIGGLLFFGGYIGG